jgi:ribosomal protein L11 methyltransferase
MPFLALRFDLGDRNADAVEASCFDMGAHAITLSDRHDDAVFEPLPGEVRLWPATRVEALFDGDSDPAMLSAQLAAEFGIEPAHIDTEWLADRAWEREWLRDFHAMRFGRRLWICPQHEQVTAHDAVVVKLDPGLAFGTGTHPSTALCLEWLDGHFAATERLVDFGCGSGVLGIAAAKLGASHVDAFDIDPQALLATADNAENNFVGHQLTLYAEVARIPPLADVVVANILASTLIELAPRLTALVRPGGRLLLAGILQNQTLAVTAAYDACFDIAPAGQREDWILLCGTRNNNADRLS